MTKLMQVSLLMLLLNAAAPLHAQEEPPAQHRRWLLAGVGMVLLGGSAAMLPDGHEGAFCATKSCLVPMGATVGGFIGLLLGADLDQRARENWNPAAQLVWSGTPAPIVGVPHRIVSGGADGATLVLTDRGLHHVTAMGTAELLPGIRVLDAAVLRDRGQLAAATAAGALRLPLSGLRADTVLAGWTSTVAASSDGGIFAGQRGSLHRLPTGGSGPAAEASGAGVPLAMETDARETLWVLWGSRVEARSMDDLALLGELPLDQPSRSMRLHGTTLALTDATGVLLVDVSDPRAPRAGARVSVPNAQGVALAADRFYVAAGDRGLYVFERTAAAPRLVGTVRDLGFVADVTVVDGVLTVLDRAGQRLLTGRADAVVVRPD